MRFLCNGVAFHATWRQGSGPCKGPANWANGAGRGVQPGPGAGFGDADNSGRRRPVSVRVRGNAGAEPRESVIYLFGQLVPADAVADVRPQLPLDALRRRLGQLEQVTGLRDRVVGDRK